MKSEEFDPESVEKARLAAEAKAAEEKALAQDAAKLGIPTELPNISEADIVIAGNVSVDNVGKVSRKTIEAEKAEKEKKAEMEAAKLGIETVSPATRKDRVVDSEVFPSKRENIEIENKKASAKLLKDLARAEKNGPTPKSIEIEKKLLDLQKIPKGRRVEALQGKIEEAKINTEKKIAEATEKGQTTKIEKLKKELESITRNVTPTDMDALKIAKEKARSAAMEKEEAKKAADKAKLEATRAKLKNDVEEEIETAQLLKGGAHMEKGKLILTDNQIAQIEADKKKQKQEEIFRMQAERHGFDSISSSRKALRTGGDMVGTIFGARVAWEATELVQDIRNKKGAKDATLELLDVVSLRNSQAYKGVETILTEDQLEESRIIENAKLLKGNILGDKAAYTLKNGQKILMMTDDQIEAARKEMNAELFGREQTKSKLDKKTIENKHAGETFTRPDGSVFTLEKTREIGPVQQKILSLNQKLKAMNLPPQEKMELRHQMARILSESRHSHDKLEAGKIEKVGKVYDVFASNSAKVMTVARESVNTAAVVSMSPWVRAIGYPLFSAAEFYSKHANIYDKRQFKNEEMQEKGKTLDGYKQESKFSYIKTEAIKSVKKTFNGFIGNWFKSKDEKGEKMTLVKKIKGFGSATFSNLGLIFSAVGIGRFEQQLAAGNPIFKEGGEKFISALVDGQLGQAFVQGGENMVHNVQNFFSMFDFSKTNETGSTSVNSTDAIKPAYTPTGHGLENNSFVVSEKSTEVLAGEGPQHAIGRQIRENLKLFGFQGDINNPHEVNMFVHDEALQVVTENHLNDVGIKEAGAKILLNADRTVNINPADTYHIPSVPEAIHNTQIHEALLAENMGSLTPNADSITSDANIVPEFHRATQFIDHIEKDVFGVSSSGADGMKEWLNVQDVSASDIVAHKFGDLADAKYYDPSGSYARTSELHFNRLADEIKLLSEKTPILKGESVEEFFKRALGIRSFDLIDYVKNPAVVENLRSIKVSDEVSNIFKHWNSPRSEEIAVFNALKKVPLKDIIEGKFGDSVGIRLDPAEQSSRIDFQKYMLAVSKKLGSNFDGNMTSENAIRAVNKISSKITFK